jgi:hypothetical protein
MDKIDDFKVLPQIYYPLFEKKVIELNLHKDILEYFTRKTE